MEKLVSIYNDVIDFDKNENKFTINVYNNKEHLIRDYIDSRLVDMKISEPNNNQKYENTFNKYLQELKSLTDSFKDDEVIFLGVFGYKNDNFDINNNDVRLYGLQDLDLLKEDIDNFYNK